MAEAFQAAAHAGVDAQRTCLQDHSADQLGVDFAGCLDLAAGGLLDLGDDGRSICGIIELASETGSGSECLNEIADDYEDELDTLANQIDKILEPITIMLLGGIVGLLVYSIYAPIFNLGSAILPKGH